MDRERFEKLLADYLTGELSTPEQRELMRFVEANPEARAELDAYEQQEEYLSRYYRLKGERAVATGPEWLAEAQPQARRPARPLLWFAAAAAAIAFIAVGLHVYQLYRTQVPTGTAGIAFVTNMQGGASVLNGETVTELTTSTQIVQLQRIKVPLGGYLALTLNDGNMIEARGGTQFTVEDLPNRLTFVLNGGQIWAHLKQKHKPFVLQTDRLRATSFGTVFGVEDGLGGTIVAVAQGSVQVEHDGQQIQIDASNSWSSRTGDFVTLSRDSIEWSRYQGDLTSLMPPDKSENADAEPLTTQETTPTTKTVSVSPIDNLIDLLPKETTMYLDMRDLAGVIRQFNTSSYAALSREPSIRKWWSNIHGAELSDSITTQTHLIEIVRIAKRLDGQCVVGVIPPEFILLADVRTQTDDTVQLLGKIQMDLAGGKFERVQRLREQAAVMDGKLIVSSNPALLGAVRARIATGKTSEFSSTDFHKRVRIAVGSKPRLAMAANMAPVVERWSQDASLKKKLDFTGLSGLDHIIIAAGFAGTGGSQAARLGFAGERYNMANWLAEPAPMRGFSFFSPDVHVFGSAIIRSPRVMFFDWLQYLIAQNTATDTARAFFDAHSALFDAVGNEIAIGVDNPILPAPNIKLALELRNPSDFARELDGLVDDYVARLGAAGRLAERQTSKHAGFTVYTLHVDGWFWEPSWAYVDDYLIAGPFAELVNDSIDVYRTGGSIARNARLLKLLPSGASSRVSLLLYQDVAKAVPTFLTTKLAAAMSAEQKAMIPDLKFLEKFHAAGIAYAIARKDSIDFCFSTPSGVDLNLGIGGRMVANWFKPQMQIGERIGRYAQAEVELQDLATAALEFQKKNNRLPASIEEMVAGGYIKSAPEDPFAKGEALRLLNGPVPGSIVLYSVGPDGVDDKGILIADPTNGKSEGDVSIILPTMDGGKPKVRTPQNATPPAAQQ